MSRVSAALAKCSSKEILCQLFEEGVRQKEIASGWVKREKACKRYCYCCLQEKASARKRGWVACQEL